MCYHCTLDWSKRALNTLLSGLRHTEGSRGCGDKEINWPDREQREGAERERLGGWVGGWREPIQSDKMMIACVVIKFLYEGPQEIGEQVNIQSNQYQQALPQSSNFLKSCWRAVPTFINNTRGGIRQRCWFKKKSCRPKNTAHLLLTHTAMPQWSQWNQF